MILKCGDTVTFAHFQPPGASLNNFPSGGHKLSQPLQNINKGFTWIGSVISVILFELPAISCFMRACIVDDEKKGRDSLQRLLEEYCPSVTVIGQADSVENAWQFINKHKPDLVFLDVEMPKGSGFELLKKFEKISFKTIFVTAHQHYAIKAIKFSAADYLLKPVDVDELIAAVGHAAETNAQNHHLHYTGLIDNLENKAGKIAIPVRDGVAFICPSEIIRFEADGAYTHIYTGSEKYTASKNIKEYEELLHEMHFFRTHNSHLINLQHVKQFSRVDGYFAKMSDGTCVEVSRRKKDQFLHLMNM